MGFTHSALSEIHAGLLKVPEHARWRTGLTVKIVGVGDFRVTGISGRARVNEPFTKLVIGGPNAVISHTYTGQNIIFDTVCPSYEIFMVAEPGGPVPARARSGGYDHVYPNDNILQNDEI